MGVIRDLNGFFGTTRNCEEPFKVLRGFLMDLKGFSEASKSPFWTLMDPLGPQGILQDLNKSLGT